MRKIILTLICIPLSMMLVAATLDATYRPIEQVPIDIAEAQAEHKQLKQRKVFVDVGKYVDLTDYFTERDIELVAKTIYGEARANWISYQDKACVAWIICNRVDSPDWDNTIEEVVTANNQFHGYSECHPVTYECYRIAEDVLTRWSMYKLGYDVYRELGPEFTAFYGDGEVNYFYEY